MREYWVIRYLTEMRYLRTNDDGGVTYLQHKRYWTGAGVRRATFGPLCRAKVHRSHEELCADKLITKLFSEIVDEEWNGFKLRPLEVLRYLRHQGRIKFSLKLSTPIGILKDRFLDHDMVAEANDLDFLIEVVL